MNAHQSSVSPQLVSEGSGQVDTSSGQDVMPLPEEAEFHSTARVDQSPFNHPRYPDSESHKRSVYQDHPAGNGVREARRKRPLSSVSPSSPLSARRRSSRKPFPRKITMMVPNTGQTTPSGVQVQSFSFYPFMQPGGQSSQTITGDPSPNLSTAGILDPPSGMCDSTAGNHEILRGMHENGHYGDEEAEPAPHAPEAYRRGVHHAYSAADDVRLHSWESSSPNDSSPGISEEQPVVVEVNSEHSSTELEHDAGETEGSPVPYRSRRARTNSFRDTNESLTLPREQSHLGMEPTETAVVTLDNAVQVKKEPAEKGGALGVRVMATESGTGEEGHADEQNHLTSCTSPKNSRRPSEQLERRLSNSSATAGEGGVTEGGANEGNTCNVCHKQFETAASLCRHKRSHSGERPFICNVCGWGFNLSGNLNQHMAIHQKVKPFRCPYCGKTFARSNVLKAHVRCHTGERPYQCHVCGSNFVISHNLKKHLLIRHGIQGGTDGGKPAGNQTQSTAQTP